MLSLFVYNQNRKKAEELNRKCLSHIKKTGKKIGDSRCFSDHSELAALIKSHEDISLYMLGKDGKLERLTENIRMVNDSNYIVLVLDSADDLIGAVNPAVRPSGILFENSDDSATGKLIDEIYRDYSRVNSVNGENIYQFYIRGKHYTESFSRIILIEVQSKLIRFHTDSQVYEFRDTLDAVMQAAPDYFIRIHRSYIVNTRFIKYINYRDKSLTMKDDSTLFFSRTYTNNVKEYVSSVIKENF